MSKNSSTATPSISLTATTLLPAIENHLYFLREQAKSRCSDTSRLAREVDIKVFEIVLDDLNDIILQHIHEPVRVQASGLLDWRLILMALDSYGEMGESVLQMYEDKHQERRLYEDTVKRVANTNLEIAKVRAIMDVVEGRAKPKPPVARGEFFVCSRLWVLKRRSDKTYYVGDSDDTCKPLFVEAKYEAIRYTLAEAECVMSTFVRTANDCDIVSVGGDGDTERNLTHAALESLS